MQVDLKFKIKAGDGQITFPIYRVPVSGGSEPVNAGDIQNLQVDLDRQVLQSSQEGAMVTAAYSNVAEGTHQIVVAGALNNVAFALVYAVRAEELGVPAEVVAPNAYVSLAPTGEGTIEQQIKDIQERMGTAEGEIMAITAALPDMATKEEVQETLGEILEAIQALPDGQAVSAQVALNTAAIEGLQEEVSQLGQEVDYLNALTQSKKEFTGLINGLNTIDYPVYKGHKYYFFNTGSAILQPTIALLTATVGGYVSFIPQSDAPSLSVSAYGDGGSFLIFDAGAIDTILQNVDSILHDNGVLYKNKVVASSADDLQWSVGFVDESGAIYTGAGYETYRYNKTPIFVIPLKRYVIRNGRTNFTTFMSVRCLDQGGSLVDVIKTAENTKTLEFVVPDGCYYVQYCFAYNGSDTEHEDSWTQLVYNDNFLLLPDGGVITPMDVLMPQKIYGRQLSQLQTFAEPVGIAFSNSVYPEGFAKGNLQLVIDGGRESVINELGKSGAFTKTVRLVAKDGKEKSVDLSIQNISPSSIPQLTKARVLCIGESTTEQSVVDPVTHLKKDGWNWPSFMNFFAQCDKIDNVGAEVQCLGVKTAFCPTSTYKDTEITPAAHYFAHGGWASYVFLNWPVSAKIQNTLGGYITAEAMWHFLGLATETPFDSSTPAHEAIAFDSANSQHIEKLAKTPFGRYKVDGHSSAWDKAKECGGGSYPAEYPAFSGTGTYSGTAEQIAALQAWADACVEKCVNVFYSVTKARAYTGEHSWTYTNAFDYSVFLSRYRTMDNAGVRLSSESADPHGESVTGSDGNTYTIGSNITTQSLLASVDVCAPTHIIVNVGINDGDGLNTVQNGIDCLSALLDELTMAANVPVAHFISRYPGVCYTGMWADVAIARQYNANRQAKVISILEGLWAWMQNKATIFPIDAYHIQYPASSYFEHWQKDYVYPNGRLDCSYDDVHMGYTAHKTIAWQCLHWLYWKLLN